MNRQKIFVFLTPRKYLDAAARRIRLGMFEASERRTITLQLLHDSKNAHDDMALKVLYKGVEIGFVRKRFFERDDTRRIERFCFKEGLFRRGIELKCTDHVLFLLDRAECEKYSS